MLALLRGGRVAKVARSTIGAQQNDGPLTMAAAAYMNESSSHQTDRCLRNILPLLKPSDLDFNGGAWNVKVAHLETVASIACIQVDEDVLLCASISEKEGIARQRSS